MKVHCKTLTPIWTGDINADSGEVKESGLIGSMRFWFEGLLRKYGKHCCGGKGDNEKCDCIVCEVFGTTGKARSFRLEAENLAQLVALEIFTRKAEKRADRVEPHQIGRDS